MKKAPSRKAEQTPEPESVYPSLYFNGFEVSVSPADVALTAKLGDIVVGKLYMSHNIAKTIVDLLGRTLATYETSAELTISTTVDISAKLEGKEGSRLD